MELNANFDKPAIVHAGSKEWVPSPMKGVDRRMLDRIGDEVARATSIVRYAPGSHFSPHTHDGGEEFLVLEGVFQDEHGDYPAGTYVRNPPTSSHTPGAETGCVIFVKLWQFQPEDRHQMSVNTNTSKWSFDEGENIESLPLYSDHHEEVCMENWSSGEDLSLKSEHGLELLVLEGSFKAEREIFQNQSWLRLPPGQSLDVKVGDLGCKLWIKRNHLKEMPTAPNR
ncbi:MAG: cupin domain-containing protein [Pseudomonadota bacterium]